ncbi:MAG: RidA family protein [Acidobacteriota bacterium]
MQKEFLNPSTLPNWSQSFSQIVVVKSAGTRTVYLAGQVSVDAENKLIGEGDLEVQTEYAFRNLATALAASGTTTADVVKLTIYIKSYRPEQAPIINNALRKYFPQDNLPTSTWLGVESLALEGLLIEIDAVAVVEGS